MKDVCSKVVPIGFLSGLEREVNLRFTVGVVVAILLVVLLLSGIVCLCAWRRRRARRGTEWVMRHPEYAAFLNEDPERQFVYDEDLAAMFSKWLGERKHAGDGGGQATHARTICHENTPRDRNPG